MTRRSPRCTTAGKKWNVWCAVNCLNSALRCCAQELDETDFTPVSDALINFVHLHRCLFCRERQLGVAVLGLVDDQIIRDMLRFMTVG